MSCSGQSRICRKWRTSWGMAWTMDVRAPGGWFRCARNTRTARRLLPYPCATARSSVRHDSVEDAHGQGDLEHGAVLDRQPECLRRRPRRDDMDERVVNEVKRDAVVGGIAGRDAAFGQEPMKGGPPFRLAVVMRARAAGQPAKTRQRR